MDELAQVDRVMANHDNTDKPELDGLARVMEMVEQSASRAKHDGHDLHVDLVQL